MRCNKKYLVTRPDHLERDPLDIGSLASCANSKYFDYVQSTLGWHGCLSGWSICYPFFKNKERLHRFLIGLYDWISSFFKSVGKGGRKEGKNWCNFEISAGAVLKLSIMIRAQTKTNYFVLITQWNECNLAHYSRRYHRAQ